MSCSDIFFQSLYLKNVLQGNTEGETVCCVSLVFSLSDGGQNTRRIEEVSDSH